mmetsp:Transcript_18703/g.52001  ORF Transcript_18703/g.52001 Transcript_18703/m.52001 type:complete len:313 (-) Transcript_18703:113-1051(-)
MLMLAIKDVTDQSSADDTEKRTWIVHTFDDQSRVAMRGHDGLFPWNHQLSSKSSQLSVDLEAATFFTRPVLVPMMSAECVDEVGGKNTGLVWCSRLVEFSIVARSPLSHELMLHGPQPPNFPLRPFEAPNLARIRVAAASRSRVCRAAYCASDSPGSGSTPPSSASLVRAADARLSDEELREPLLFTTNEPPPSRSDKSVESRPKPTLARPLVSVRNAGCCTRSSPEDTTVAAAAAPDEATSAAVPSAAAAEEPSMEAAELRLEKKPIALPPLPPPPLLYPDGPYPPSFPLSPPEAPNLARIRAAASSLSRA